jgi:hypothetical protein
MANQKKSERMALDLHVSRAIMELFHASRCILLELSVDPPCLRLSHSVVPLLPSFLSAADNIAVTSNAYSCAYELRLSVVSNVHEPQYITVINEP